MGSNNGFESRFEIWNKRNGEFISNFILNKDDLMYFNSGNVTIGQSTIFLKNDMLLIFELNIQIQQYKWN
jgi:hypothetical protein